MNIIDKKINELFSELEIFSLEEIKNHILEKLKLVSPELQQRINDFFVKFPFWGTLFDKENNTIDQISKFLKENTQKLKNFYFSLSDYYSKKIFYAIINNWYNFDFANLSEIMEKKFPHYFDLDLITNTKILTFVDIGAYTGDTIKDFLTTYNEEYKKIYAYEMTEESMKKLKENVYMYPRIIYKEKALSDFVGKGTINVNDVSSSSNQIIKDDEGNILVTTLDEDIDEKIDIIKIDIEGGEYNAIKGMTKHIEEDRPILLLSIYHGFNDFIRIWEYVYNLKVEYEFYLRYYGGPIFPTEIVLVCLPK